MQLSGSLTGDLGSRVSLDLSGSALFGSGQQDLAARASLRIAF